MRRDIQKVLHGKPVVEGAGVHLHRVFGFNEVPLFDPFLMLDDFRSDVRNDYIKGFPWHPHRGIETITYVLTGDVEHGDSLGNRGVITSGDVQWMTAGSGIIHQEMPKGDQEGVLHGFQVWANLPASSKMMEPRYRDITAKDIPVVRLDNGTVVKVIAGELAGARGPADDIIIDPEYLDCTVPAGTRFQHPTRQGYTVFLYVIDGVGLVNELEVTNRTAILFADGDEILVTGGTQSLRFLLFSGKPLGEPVAWRGPIVMNTQDELDQAFSQLQQNSFIRQQE